MFVALWLFLLTRLDLRTFAGRDLQARVLADPGSTGTGNYAPANFVAFTEDPAVPAEGDTTLVGELTGGGLQRGQATYAHTAGALTYTLTRSVTSSDPTARKLNKVGVFNAPTGGTMMFETLVPSPPTIVSGDSVTTTSTITM